MFLLAQFLFSIFYSYTILVHKNQIMKSIIFVYSKVDISKAEFTFYTIMPTFMIFECMFFVSGIWAILKKSLSGLDIFNFIC